MPRTAHTDPTRDGSLPVVDITAPAFKADPFPFYARLRAEAPVLRVDVPRMGRAWLVTRYDDVAAALKDERLLKSRPGKRSVPRMFSALERGLLNLDGADHDRLRALVHKAFTPRRVERMNEDIQQLADELLGAAERRGGAVDLIADYALPLPLTVIGRILGVPEADHPRFSAWSRNLIGAAARRNPLGAVPGVWAFLRYLRRLIAERTERPRDDLVSALALAREGDDRLTADEVLTMIVLLLTAGHETTVNLIGSGTLALLQHPDQLARLRDDPSLIGPAVEELVRFVVPAEQATQRYAREDVTIAGVTVPQGSLVLAVLASANRDPHHFPDPDALDVGRTPNRHLSFGQGVHYCLGASLSRLEARIAITTLLRRDVRLAVPAESLRWRGGVILRGLDALPVTLA